jgi:DNA-binding NarL/FixJ family response regulator
MNGASLHGLPQLLRLLGTYAPPEAVVSALWRGPLSAFGARGGQLWHVRDGEVLVRLAYFGTTAEESDRYSVMPITLPIDAPQAARTQQLVVSDAQGFATTTLDAIDADLLGAMFTRLSIVSLVSAPILHDGQSVGVLGWMSSTPWPDDEHATALLDVITGALALWMTHPLTGIGDGSGPGPQAQERSLALTPRQAEIMRGVEKGESYQQIAVRLRVSESTVKQDAQSVMRSLRTTERLVAAERARTLGLL